MGTTRWRENGGNGGNGGNGENGGGIGIGAGVASNLVCVSSVLKRFDKLTLLTTHNVLPRQALFSNHQIVTICELCGVAG